MQFLTEQVPAGDEGSAQGVVLGQEGFEFRAGLANVPRERGFVVHDLEGIGASLQQLGRQPV